MTDDLHPTTVERAETPVLYKTARDEQADITRAWTELEEAVGSLRGRRFYGLFDPATNEYRACVEPRDGDDPRQLGLGVGSLPGGRYARVRIHGEPPALYARIAPTVARLEQERSDQDPDRPVIEFYRRHDAIDVLVPVH